MSLALAGGWMAQELLSTFPDELGEVALVPGGSGIFEIRLNDELIWSRHEQDGFPKSKSSNNPSEIKSPRTGAWATLIANGIPL